MRLLITAGELFRSTPRNWMTEVLVFTFCYLVALEFLVNLITIVIQSWDCAEEL